MVMAAQALDRAAHSTAAETPITPAAQDLYNQVFTLHGAILVFMFIIPAVPAILGNMILPLMLGAKDVAFPRLNLASWYLYVIGGFFALISVSLGGVDTGWTFYIPYASSTADNVFFPIIAAFILGWSSILTGINLIVTVHRLKVPSMGWFQMPLFVWAMYATSWIQVLATPVVGITILMILKV